MIVSASRRTDIPAFYARWFINRVRAGYCAVPNPFNAQQVARVSLRPADVDAIVFWTRSPRPLLRYLDELDDRGYRYYFQFTLLRNPRWLDQDGPAFPAALDAFQRLARRVGPEQVIWRYDPIVLTSQTPLQFHADTFAQIAAALRGSTRRAVISVMTPYRKAQRRLNALERQFGVRLALRSQPSDDCLERLVHQLQAVAGANGMALTSCADEAGLARWGVEPGKCVDNRLLSELFGLDIPSVKDPGQRPACGCVPSRDIGVYDTCLFGCVYCYATNSFARARANYRRHDPESPSLVGWYGAPTAVC
ncbi:MAG: DUF1848 domain-containing protein [Aggregatilineales bacterium]